jgi:lipoprotein signal peptidase
MAERTYRWLLISLAVVGLSVDQASKYGVFRWLYNDGVYQDLSGNSFEVVPGWFKLIAQFDHATPPCDCGLQCAQTWSAPVMPRVNNGALFGMGQSRKGLANGFFAVVSVAAALAILVWGTRGGPAREKWLSAALGLILGGTVGNLYDRLVFGGVRDFMYFYFIEWPVFNFADCCLVVGAGLLLVQAVFVPPPPAEQPAAEPPAPAAPTA